MRDETQESAAMPRVRGYTLQVRATLPDGARFDRAIDGIPGASADDAAALLRSVAADKGWRDVEVTPARPLTRGD